MAKAVIALMPNGTITAMSKSRTMGCTKCSANVE